MTAREWIDSLTDEQLKHIAWAGSYWADMNRYEDDGLIRLREELYRVLDGKAP